MARGPAKRGFTLIELLVVIAIIAILAAILFPVFAKAREKARSSSCMSNCKQIGIAIMQYMQDYDEMLVMRNGANPSLPNSTWVVYLQPYIKSYQTFVCPSASSQMVDTTNWNTWGNPGGYCVNNLGYDGTVSDPPAAEAGPWGNMQGIWHLMPKLSRFGAPAETILFGDAVANGSAQVVFYGYGPGNNPPTLGNTGNQSYFVARHTDMCNFAFVDGHVKAMKVDAVIGNNFNLLRLH